MERMESLMNPPVLAATYLDPEYQALLEYQPLT